MDIRADKKAKFIGLGVTLSVHVSLLFICLGSGFKHIYPPPQEKGILMEFVYDEPKPIQVKTGIEPRSKRANPNEDVRLVQKAESPEKGTKENKVQEATIGEKGDYDKYEPPRTKEIDKRALFASNKNKGDSSDRQVADNPSNKLVAGHPEGNTKVGAIDGTPSAKLEGRTIMGNLPLPTYNVEKSGKVVVRILVDQYGKVTNAIPGIKGTTVQDAVLWEAAKKAALDAKFNISSSAPSVQEGTITYIFKLK